ncbi:hypothetical protein JL720_16109 [Aureococcus anophagefferens]|nr:hypothetical protein JL720_16109 [Aureococcus anophagefferens]
MEARPPTSRPAGGVVRGGHLGGEGDFALAARRRRRRDPLRYVFESSVHVKRMEARPPTSRPAGGVVRGGRLGGGGDFALAAAAAARDPLRYVFESSVHVKRMEARPPTSRPAGGVVRGGHLDDGGDARSCARRRRRGTRSATSSSPRCTSSAWKPGLRPRGPPAAWSAAGTSAAAATSLLLAAAAARDPLRYVFESSVHVKRMEARPPTSRSAGGVVRGGRLGGEERLRSCGAAAAARDPLRYVFESSVHVKRMEARPPTSRPAGGVRRDPLRYVFESSVHVKRMEARPPTSRPAGGVVRGRHLGDGGATSLLRGGGGGRDPLRYVFESSVHVKRMEARPQPRGPPAAWSAAGTSTTAATRSCAARRRRRAGTRSATSSSPRCTSSAWKPGLRPRGPPAAWSGGHLDDGGDFALARRRRRRRDPLRYVFESSVHVKRMEARPPTSRPAGGVVRGGHLDDGEERLALARRGRRPARRDPLRYVFESSVHVKRMEARPPTSSPAGGVIRVGHLDDGEERLALARRGRRPARRDPLRYVFESSVHVKRMEARPPTSSPAGGVIRVGHLDDGEERLALARRGRRPARRDPLRYVFESSVHVKRMEARPPTSRPAGGVVRGGHLDDGEERLALARRGRRPARRDPLRYVFESSVHVKRMEARPPTSRPAGGVVRGGHLDDGEERLALARRGRRPARRDPLRYVFESSVHVKRMEARPPTSSPAGGVIRVGHLDDGEERLALARRGRRPARRDPLRYVFKSSVHAKRMQARPPTSRPAGGVVRGGHLDDGEERLGAAGGRRAGTRSATEDADVRAALKATIISLGGYDDVSNIVAESTSTRRRLQDEDGAKVSFNATIFADDVSAAEDAAAEATNALQEAVESGKFLPELKAQAAERSPEAADALEGAGVDKEKTLDALAEATVTVEVVTAKPTPEPSAEPTPNPSAEPTAKPTDLPTGLPTANSTANSTDLPTAKPTDLPTGLPTANSTGNTRATRVFAWNSGGEAWVQRGGDIGGEAAYDYSGVSVSLSADGTALAVGAYENDGAGSNAARARVCVGPVERRGFSGYDIDGEDADDQSGYSVSLSADGTALAVGAHYNDGGGTGGPRACSQGPVDETWKQRGDDIDGEAADDRSGYSVSLSADGTALAVGAHYNDGGGTDAGHARVFAWDSDENEWKQRGDDIDGEAASDWSGYSVSLSADGTALAVGAIFNDGAGSTGHARVFDLSSA